MGEKTGKNNEKLLLYNNLFKRYLDKSAVWKLILRA